jgi:hypothetical protein
VAESLSRGHGQHADVHTENNLPGNSPFLIGVSGHRDLHPDELSRLDRVIREFILQLRLHLPDTDFQLLVGMAAGADLLVAQVAIDAGVKVQALLPMPLAQYAEDFAPDDLRLLEELLSKPGVTRVELATPAHLAEAHGAAHNVPRDARYDVLSDALLRRSSLLVALWDGRSAHLPGGTGDTVLRYLGVRSGSGPEQVIVSFVDAEAEAPVSQRPVYWVPVARAGGSAPFDVRSPCFLRGIGDNTLEMHRQMPTDLVQQLTALNGYNREYAHLQRSGRLAAPDSLLDKLPADLPLDERMMLADIDAQYGKADALAVHYQRRSDGLFLLFGMMTFAMAAAFLIYEKLFESAMLLVVYVLLLLTGIAVYSVLRRRQWFAKHLTYRALAETMRAKFYLRLAGIDHRVDAAGVLGLSGIDRFQGFSWIGCVLKAFEVPDAHAPVPHEEQLRRSRCVEETWIESQYCYFARKVSALERSIRRVKGLQIAMVLVILAVMVTLIVSGHAVDRDSFGVGVSVRNTLTFFMGLLALLLAVWKLHQGKMATRELLWQYRNQLTHFSEARRQLARTSSQHRRNDVFFGLGKDSLMESYLWTIHRYHREHEPSLSG